MEDKTMKTTTEVMNLPENMLGQASQKIQDALDVKGMGIRELARAVGITYEHSRRICRGEGLPSRIILREICRVLALDFEEMNKLVTADKIEKKFGGVPMELAGKTPALAPLERIWGDLTTDQQNDLVKMGQQWAKRNKLTV
jgi:transcriptional regulator with XRE-family HTH domain